MNNNRKPVIWAFIFARGGSKGVPGKNIRVLGDKPLLAHSIQVAHECPSIDRVLVSTDDETIAGVAREWGAEVPFMRPKELAQDNSPEWLAWQHALQWLEESAQLPDIFVSLPTTSPLRSVEDVERCIQTLDAETDMVVTATQSHRSPWFNMLKRDSSGNCRRILENPAFTRRQDAPETLDMTTVAYVSRPDFIMERQGVFDGRVKAVEIPAQRAVDIDTALDFSWAEFLLQNGERYEH